ncbi:MAG: DnaJ domain-containing protein [Kiritimatiellae bacterium]|nr:DnaJ domain-containing protein [Kiritimatiellia bacterium]
MDDRNVRRYLTLLNLPNRFDETQLKEAYRDIAHVWHPDKFGHSQRLRNKAESVFKEINEANQYFKQHMHAGVFAFVEKRSSERSAAVDSGPEMDEILRVVEEELKKQYEGRIQDVTRKYNDEVAELRQKHNDYIDRITRTQGETQAQYEARVRKLATSLEDANSELSKEKAKADQLQKIVQRSFFSINAARTIFERGIVRPVIATTRISAEFIKHSRETLIHLIREHLPDRYERVVVLSTLGFLSIVILLVLAVVTPNRILIPFACTFAIVASSAYLASSSDKTKTGSGANRNEKGSSNGSSEL